ncbi:hypothetical protein HAX54_017286, partial [Datura stramonium]|nr:hypothetical protein [Datura stramonium]
RKSIAATVPLWLRIILHGGLAAWNFESAHQELKHQIYHWNGPGRSSGAFPRQQKSVSCSKTKISDEEAEGMIFGTIYWGVIPLQSLEGKGAPGRDMKKRKTDSKDDSDGPGSDGADSSWAYWILSGGALSSALLWTPRDYRERLPHHPRPMLGDEVAPRVPKLFSRDILEYSFLNGGEDKEASDPGDNNDEASS